MNYVLSLTTLFYQLGWLTCLLHNRFYDIIDLKTLNGKLDNIKN